MWISGFSLKTRISGQALCLMPVIPAGSNILGTHGCLRCPSLDGLCPGSCLFSDQGVGPGLSALSHLLDEGISGDCPSGTRNQKSCAPGSSVQLKPRASPPCAQHGRLGPHTGSGNVGLTEQPHSTRKHQAPLFLQLFPRHWGWGGGWQGVPGTLSLPSRSS